MAPRVRKLFPILGILALLIVALLLWALDPHRKVPLRKVFNPTEWVRHWQGRDHYDSTQALLQEGDPNIREVALTFDDGPDPRYGPAIAAILKQKNVPATFFLVGMRVKQYPEVARLLAQDGFELANHTYNHQDLPALKPHEIANELRLCDQDIFQATGRHTTLMRPPGVQYSDKVLNVAKALGYVTVSWTVGAKDYETDTSADFIKERVLDRTAPGAIILLHQDTSATVAALPSIIDTLRSQGYRFVTISQMLDHLHARLPASNSSQKNSLGREPLNFTKLGEKPLALATGMDSPMPFRRHDICLNLLPSGYNVGSRLQRDRWNPRVARAIVLLVLSISLRASDMNKFSEKRGSLPHLWGR